MIIFAHKVGSNLCIISTLQLLSGSTHQVLSLLTVAVSLDSAGMILPAMEHQPLSESTPSAWLCCTPPAPALSSKHVYEPQLNPDCNLIQRTNEELVQAWTEQAGRQVGMRKEGAKKLHRLAMVHLYGSWAPPSTWLHTSSPAPACMAAVMAAWSHALQVHALSRVMLSHSTCHAFTLPVVTKLQSIGSLAFFVTPEFSSRSCPLDFQFMPSIHRLIAWLIGRCMAYCLSMALVNVCLQKDQVLDVWCGHAGCSEHSQICSLAHAVWLHHTTPAGMVKPYGKSSCSASGTTQTRAWNIAVSMYAGVLASSLSCHVSLSAMLV